MIPLLFGLVMLIGCWTSPMGAQAASATIAWDYNTTAPLTQTGFQVLRCTIPSGANSCVPSADLAGGTPGATTLLFTDTTAVAGSSYCYTVIALGARGRSAPAITAAGVPYICPLPAPTNLREISGAAATSMKKGAHK